MHFVLRPADERTTFLSGCSILRMLFNLDPARESFRCVPALELGRNRPLDFIQTDAVKNSNCGIRTMDRCDSQLTTIVVVCCGADCRLASSCSGVARTPRSFSRYYHFNTITEFRISMMATLLMFTLGARTQHSRVSGLTRFILCAYSVSAVCFTNLKWNRNLRWDRPSTRVTSAVDRTTSSVTHLIVTGASIQIGRTFRVRFEPFNLELSLIFHALQKLDIHRQSIGQRELAT